MTWIVSSDCPEATTFSSNHCTNGREISWEAYMPNLFLWLSQIQASRTNSSANWCNADVSWWVEYQNVSGNGAAQSHKRAELPTSIPLNVAFEFKLRNLSANYLHSILGPRWLIIFRFLNRSQPSYSYKYQSLKHLNRKKYEKILSSVYLVYILNNVVNYCLSTRCWGLGVNRKNTN